MCGGKGSSQEKQSKGAASRTEFSGEGSMWGMGHQYYCDAILSTLARTTLGIERWFHG